ncbi:MAG: SRPBCC family protein [Parvularculaceae bacterium]
MDQDTITRQIRIEADPQRVWEALTDAVSFGEWFRVKLDGPFVVGAKTTGAMTYPGHEGVRWISVTEALEAPHRFVFRWPDCPPGEEAGPGAVWLTVEFILEPQDGGTLVTVTETGFAVLAEDRRVSMLRDNAEGWEIQAANLKNYVEG